MFGGPLPVMRPLSSATILASGLSSRGRAAGIRGGEAGAEGEQRLEAFGLWIADALPGHAR